MNPPFDIAADLDTPVSAFLKLASLRPRFLLESVVGGERVGRYSFIGFGEAMEVRLCADALVVDGVARPIGLGRGPFLDALRELVAKAPRPGVGTNLPFQGGLVGYVGYDVVRRFERLPVQATETHEPEAAWMAPRSLLVFDHATRRCAVLHDGDASETAALRRDVVMALRGAVPPRAIVRGGFRSGAFGSARPSMRQAQFEEGVETVRGAIREGDVYQLVLSIGFRGECALEPFQVYRALRLGNPSPYMVFLDFGDMAVVGSSPEALVRLDGRRATLRPIAGTRPRGADTPSDLALEQELLADPKEASEHVMLVDLARNDLSRVAQPGTVGVDPYRIIERYSHVMHIVSGVNGILREDCDPFDLFAATFPAGTVVGAPKVRAMELIEGLEPVRRGPYAGTVGYFGHGDAMDQAITIRTVWFSRGQYAIQAGAGIVADSDPTREYREVRAKAAALEAAMTLAEQGL